MPAKFITTLVKASMLIKSQIELLNHNVLIIIGNPIYHILDYSLAGMFWNWLTAIATLVYWWHQSHRGQTISTIYAAKPGNLLECYTGSFTPGLTQAHCFASTLPAYVHTWNMRVSYGTLIQTKALKH